jgi:hypothetical protein
LRIAKDGRRLRNFNATTSAVCVTGTFPGVEIQIVVIPFPRAKIARYGHFSGEFEVGETRIDLRGRLVGRRVKNGRVRYKSPICSAEQKWSARRIGG